MGEKGIEHAIGTSQAENEAPNPFGTADFSPGALKVGQAHDQLLLQAPVPRGGMAIFSVEGPRAYATFANERARMLFKGTTINGGAIELDDLVAQLPIGEQNVKILRERGECVVHQVPVGNDTTTWHIVVARESDDSLRTVVLANEIFARDVRSIEALQAGAGPVKPHSDGAPDVFIRTFGYFDVFVNGQAVVFPSAKSKELLALLVDRRGGTVTSSEAVSCLWENEPATPVVLSRQRKVAMRMRNTLEEYGIGHIVTSVKGKRRLNVDAVRCDLYDYLAGDPDTAFKGTYLQNYSWGEVTLGELLATMPFHE